MARTVAALYIDPRGPYPRLADVECYDETRDARTYAGPYPVVAHPPCGPWGQLKRMSREDPRLAIRAVEQVQAFGGVLEHPAGSGLWRACDLPLPGDQLALFQVGQTVEVEQVRWGHACTKPTWIYAIGVSPVPVPPYPDREPTHGIWYGERDRERPGPRLRVASSEIRRRTPIAFAEWLVELARCSQAEPGRAHG